MQFRWSLALILDAHAERTLEITGGVDHGLGCLAFKNPIPWRMAYLELTTRDPGGGDDLEIGHGNEIEDFQFAPADDRQGRGFHTPNPDNAAGALAKVRVSDRL